MGCSAEESAYEMIERYEHALLYLVNKEAILGENDDGYTVIEPRPFEELDYLVMRIVATGDSPLEAIERAMMQDKGGG